MQNLNYAEKYLKSITLKYVIEVRAN